jgi:hypothetical protein
MNNKMLTDELKKQYSKKKRSRDKHYHTKKQLKRKVRYQKYDKEY